MARLRQLRLRFTTYEELPAEPFGDPRVHLPWVARPQWRPACDVYETGMEWIVKAEIAGVDDEDIEVRLYEDTLVIEGARPWRTDEHGEILVHTAEIRHGAFQLAVRVPEGIDRDRATRTYGRGLLLVRLPKARSS